MVKVAKRNLSFNFTEILDWILHLIGYAFTLVILSIVRLLLPKVLLPATTALATLSENGTVKGLEAGANVIMPNISPTNIRNLYTLYNNKKITGGESLEGINNLKGMLKQYGYEVIVGRGDSLI